MTKIKVNFGYFWPGFDPSDNFYTRVLSRKYTVELSDDPDLFIFTHPYNHNTPDFQTKRLVKKFH